MSQVESTRIIYQEPSHEHVSRKKNRRGFQMEMRIYNLASRVSTYKNKQNAKKDGSLRITAPFGPQIGYFPASRNW
ncbi:hypothetical protein DL346_25500 [Paenibacillus montanisoli]|uniref:Uncharacterized protein n=1 Tax=Paenibacillus montanisoli TaxID=2081970 RepID=A0A328TTL5_9BACL|nr:hypothetical protein DL346_25500 [Paenibacillus montanisoli]